MLAYVIFNVLGALNFRDLLFESSYDSSLRLGLSYIFHYVANMWVYRFVIIQNFS